jgi:predicted DNA-binding transcriptional regulator
LNRRNKKPLVSLAARSGFLINAKGIAPSMKNNIRKHRIGIVDFALVDAGLSHHEALIYAYVKRFQRNKRPCFASITHIAAELRMSAPTVKRHIRRLLQLQVLTETVRGRGRFLSTNGIKMIPIKNRDQNDRNRDQIDLDRDQNDPGDWDQNDPLPLKVLPLKDTNKSTMNDSTLDFKKLNTFAERSGLRRRFGDAD